MTVIEVTIASMILIIVMATFLGGLISFQNAEQFTRERNEALDDLRLMANTFAKETRHAATILDSSPEKLTMLTYDGAVSYTTPTEVTYEVVADSSGHFNLRRVRGAATRVFNIRLTTDEIFSFNDQPVGTLVAPADVRSVEVEVTTKLSERNTAVSLSTEVNLRNVRD